MLNQFPIIDYEKHPAFDHDAANGFAEDALWARVRALDELRAAVEGGREARHGDVAEVLGEVERLLAGIGAELFKAGMPAVALELALASLARAGDELKAWLHFAAMRRAAGESASDGSLAASLSQLRDSGCCVIQVSPALKRRFGEACRPLIDELRKRQSPQSLTRNYLELDKAAIRALRRLSRDSGADRIAESYTGSKVFVGASIELSHGGQRWDENIYQAHGVPHSKLRYLHTDESAFVPKAMLYLTPVGPDSGPTSFVPGSNKAKRSEFQQTYFKALDRVTTDRFLPLAGGRYRPFVRNAETRKLFMTIPRLFRGTSHFGDDLLNGEPLERELSGLETPFFDASGASLCLFDGARTLHRGSNIGRGERIAVQLGFYPALEKRARLKARGVEGGLQLARLLYGEARKYF